MIKYLIVIFLSIGLTVGLNLGHVFGIPLPLPHRIPKPTGVTMSKMTECGITVALPQEDGFCKYTLPSGWKMVDDSWREDLPRFHIIDDQQMIRFSITGAWKGTYDNELRIRTAHEPKPFVPRIEELIPSETSPAAMMGKFGEALDHLHRPPVKLSANRQEDYAPN